MSLTFPLSSKNFRTTSVSRLRQRKQTQMGSTPCFLPRLIVFVFSSKLTERNNDKELKLGDTHYVGQYDRNLTAIRR